jgi:hypothetical protein
MGLDTKTVGGGSATGLANDFVKFLQQGLNTGTFGTGDANSMDHGIGSVLNNLFSNGAGTLGGAAADQITKETDRNAAALRSRFGASGGTAFGTGAQFAESLLRSESAPKIATAVGGLQLSALSPILQSIFGLSQKGIPQAENLTTPSAFSQIAQGLGTIAPIIAAPFTGGMSMLPSLSQASSLPFVSNSMTNLNPTSIPNLGSITIGG